MVSKTFGKYEILAKRAANTPNGYESIILGSGAFILGSCTRRAIFKAFKTLGIQLPKGCDLEVRKTGEVTATVSDEYFLSGCDEPVIKTYLPDMYEYFTR